MKRANRTTSVCAIFAVVVAMEALSSQQPNPPAPTITQEHPQGNEKSRPLTTDEQSCKDFVQGFYDWYWNRYLSHMNEPNAGGFKMPTMDEIIRHRPQLLSAQLQRLLKADATLKAQNSDGIVGLEIDPFLNDGNGSGANAPFNVQNVVVEGGRCQIKLSRGYPDSEVRPELMKVHSGWIFLNFRYSFPELPDDDLIHMLE